MITFQSSNNIIITKRSNYSSLTKNSDKKEKTSNNFYKTKNKQNILFNKTTLSLSSLKLKSKSNKNNKNMVNSNKKKKASNVNSPKIIKSKNKNNKQKFENNKENTKSNPNAKNICNINPMKKDKNKINNENLQNNILLTINNDFNHYPIPEPMPIKISKNNHIKSDREKLNKNNDYFSPTNILSNIDLDINKSEMKFNYYEKFQSEKNYYSTLKKFFETNSSKELKKHKKNNINLINNNNFQNFIQNINNINNNEKIDNNNDYDKRMIYILRNLDLDNLINKFNYNCINFNDLFLLTKQDLMEMKIPIGQRNRLMHFLENYRNCAKNYDFNEIKKYLDIYKNMYTNNAFLSKSGNVDTTPNFINSKNYRDYRGKNTNNSKDNENIKDFFFKEKIINNKAKDAKNLINNKIIESDINDKTKDFEIDSSNLIKTNLNSEISNINNTPNNISKINNKKEMANISTFQRNSSNIESNKNYPTFSSISNSKGTSIEEINYQDNNNINKKNKKKNYSTITSNIELSDTAATSTTINNKIKSNHILQKCNNLLNEVDNFNTIYSQLKQKSQNRNKQISLLLNKKNNIDYFRDKINYNEINLKKNKTNDDNKIYSVDNDYFYDEYVFNQLNSLQEESIRDLNKELKLNLWK